MNTREKVELAIESNVHWYDAMCEAHGVPGEHHRAYWVNRRRMPPYMSNLITLTDDDEATQVQAIRGLIAGGAGSGVKDSFRCLSLAPLGLQVLFHATWIFRAPGRPTPPAHTDVRWTVVATPAELQTWERTWRGVSDNEEARPLDSVFRPSLLERGDFHFLLGSCDGEPVATAALNRSARAVGLSNVFSATREPAQLFPGCVRAARALVPDLPLVGYERDAHLLAAVESGFEALHDLSVWVGAAT
ncbi:MAG: hypothetical protein K0R38_2489 [Polyangiaceae bacterium]|nr:hypothetical protein [Polyangiaceae bacterium]